MHGLSRFAFFLLVVHWLAQHACALGTEEHGNKPLVAQNYAEWKDIMPVINDKARVYQRWVNGNEHFFFRGKTKELNAALANFAKIEAKHHVVVFRPGAAAEPTFDKQTLISYNWQLHVVGGIAKARATDDPEDLEWQKWPVLTVYVDDNIDLDKLKIPAGVTVRTVAPREKEAESVEAVRRKLERFLKRDRSGSTR
jgi:hypothetical protein